MNNSIIIPPVSIGPSERGLKQYFIDNFKKCDTFLDLGAADGWYSYLATLHMKPNSSIYLIEGDPRYGDGTVEDDRGIRTSPYGLQAMIDSWKDLPEGENKFVKYIQALVTSEEQYKTSPKGVIYGADGHSSFTNPNMFGYSQKWEIDNITLDSLDLPKTEKVFVKCDVEGAELDVVKGSLNLIKNNQSVWLVEIHNQFLSKRGQNSNSIKQIFFDHGYEFAPLGHTRSGLDIEFWMFKNF